MQTPLMQPMQRRLARKSAKKTPTPKLNPDMLVQLYELLEGEREMVRVFSKALNEEICFVNPELVDVEKLPVDLPVYTTREIAFVLSMQPDEFRRYHYLKTRLA